MGYFLNFKPYMGKLLESLIQLRKQTGTQRSAISKYMKPNVTKYTKTVNNLAFRDYETFIKGGN